MRRLALVAGLVLGVTSVFADPPGVKEEPSESWEAVIAQQIERYPEVRAEDLYKLTHQATYGPGHLIRDVESARRFLAEELAAVVADEAEPLIEGLGDKLVRVNLRAFKAAEGDAEDLLAALVTSANTVRGDTESMSARLSECQRLLQASGRASEAARLQTLAAELRAKGFPAIHHSAAYREAYQPAYRVVLRSLVPTGGIPGGS